MAEHDIFTSIINASADGIDLANGDSLYLAPGIELAGLNGHAGIYGAGVESVTVAGFVFGSGYGIDLPSLNQVVQIEAGGSVTGGSGGFAGIAIGGGSITNAGTISGGIGIEFLGDANTIVNNGEILASGVYGVQMLTGGNVIFNTGLIEGNIVGIGIQTGQSGATADHIVNAGVIRGGETSISGGDAPVLLTNSGSLYGDADFAQEGIGAVPDTLDNTGQIHGVVDESGAGLTARNSGTIDADVAGDVAGVDAQYADGNILIDNSGTITGPQGILFGTSDTGGINQLTNTGRIGATGIAILDGAGGTMDITNGTGGTIIGATGIQFAESATSGDILKNDGTVDATGTAVIETGTGQLSVTNTGGIAGKTGVQFASTAGSDALDNSGTIHGANTAVYESGPAGLDVANSGTILGQWGLLFVTTTMGEDTVQNSGVIHGLTTAVAAEGGGALSAGNSGTIVGATAIQFETPAAVTDFLDNSGTIRGTSSAAIIDDTTTGVLDLTNSGHIVGAIDFGGGNDTYDGTLGSVTGLINGGSGNDVLIGGKGSENFSAGAGNDTVYGDGGNDVMNPGGGHDVLNGGDGNDTFNMVGGFDALDSIDGGSGNDTVTLQGDYSAGVIFSDTTMVNVELVTLSAGHSYKLTTADATVAAGAKLTIDGSTLGATDVLTFNGAAETDGHFVVNGGAGNDVIEGGNLSDTLNGGGGHDIFVYQEAGQSTSLQFDKLIGFDFSTDKFDLDVTVTGIDAGVASGRLGTTNFDNNLATAINAAHLAAGHAVLFNPTIGNEAGHIFLIVDANGIAGYQAGQDYVFDVTGSAHQTSLTTANFI